MNRLRALLERLRQLKLSPLQGWQRTAAWAGLGVFLFTFFLAVTFPYDAVRARLALQAEASGLSLHIDSLGPAFLGITARGVRVSSQDPATLATPVRVDRLTLRPSLFPWGVGFSADLFGGQASGSIGTGAAPSIRFKIRGLSLKKSALQAVTGIDGDGTVDADVSLDVPAGTARGPGPDYATASGNVRLGGKGLAIQGGTVNIPMMGQMTPQDLPAVNLGSLDLELPIEKGLGTLKTFHLDGSDIEIRATGTLKLARALAYAEPDVVFRLRPLPDFLRRIGIVGALVSQLPVDPTDSAFRNAKMTGYLGKPAFRPGR